MQVKDFKEGDNVDKFSIINTGANKGDIKYLVTQLKRNGLIAGMETDRYGDSVYHTHSINSVKKIADEYEGLMVDL